MTHYTPNDQGPGIDVLSVYDASAGMFASIGRQLKKEAAVKEAFRKAIELEDQDTLASELLKELDEIDST